jgi:hypothetical protein
VLLGQRNEWAAFSSPYLDQDPRLVTFFPSNRDRTLLHLYLLLRKIASRKIHTLLILLLRQIAYRGIHTLLLLLRQITYRGIHTVSFSLKKIAYWK